MLKIVPDPPCNFRSLEDTLLMATDHALCAEAVAQQAVSMLPKSPVSLLMTSSMHELEALRRLLDVALAHVQKPTDLQAMH